MSSTLQEIQRSAVEARDLLNAWAEDDRKGDVLPIYRAVNKLFAFFDSRTCPHGQTAMTRLKKVIRDWSDYANRGPMPPDFASELAAAVEAILREPPRLDWSLPAEMAAAGVPQSAICKTWRIEMHDLDRELQQPGSVVNAGHVAKIEREIQRVAGFGDGVEITFEPPAGPVFAIDAEHVAESAKPAGPTLEAMICDGANLVQIKRWHPTVTPQEIVQRAAEIGCRWPPHGSGQMCEAEYRTPACDVSADLEVPLTSIYSHDELVERYGEAEAARLEAAASGTAVAEISDEASEALRLRNDGLSWPQVAKRLGVTQRQAKGLVQQAHQRERD